MSVETSVAQGAAYAMKVGDGLVTIGLIETAYAACVIPGAWDVMLKMLQGSGMPGGVGDAAVAWTKGGHSLGEAREGLEDVIRGIPEDAWSSADREAFENKMKSFGDQLEGARIFTDAVALALIIVGTALTLFAGVMVILGTELAIQATMILTEASTVVGAVAAAAQEAEANALAVETGEALEGYVASMKALSKYTAIALGSSEFIHEDMQLLMGNFNMLGDVAGGTLKAAPEMIWSHYRGKFFDSGLEGEGMPRAAAALGIDPGDLKKVFPGLKNVL